MNEAGVEAILCLQSDDCLDALGIPLQARAEPGGAGLARSACFSRTVHRPTNLSSLPQEIRNQAIARGVVHARCAVRDFNHADQAGQLPQAVRFNAEKGLAHVFSHCRSGAMLPVFCLTAALCPAWQVSVLHTLLLSNKRVYVHCTAGINRATLTVVGCGSSPLVLPFACRKSTSPCPASGRCPRRRPRTRPPRTARVVQLPAPAPLPLPAPHRPPCSLSPPLPSLSYLTFIKSWRLEDALAHVKARRPCAHPYVDCWKTARKRLLEGRGDELTARAPATFPSPQC